MHGCGLCWPHAPVRCGVHMSRQLTVRQKIVHKSVMMGEVGGFRSMLWTVDEIRRVRICHGARERVESRVRVTSSPSRFADLRLTTATGRPFQVPDIMLGRYSGTEWHVSDLSRDKSNMPVYTGFSRLSVLGLAQPAKTHRQQSATLAFPHSSNDEYASSQS